MAKISDEISDEIRRWCEAGYDIDDLRDACDISVHDELRVLADRIDSEMVELPKDADGVPIHVGDTVYLDDGSKAVVTCIKIERGSHGDEFKLLDESFSRLPNYLTHERHDSLKRIADELEGLSVDSMVSDTNLVSSCALDLAKRIRRLAEREGQR